MTPTKLLEFTDLDGAVVTLTRQPHNELHLAIDQSWARNYVRIDLGDAERLAAALSGARRAPGLLAAFPDLDGDAVILTREPDGRLRLRMHRIEDWHSEAEFGDPDADRLAAALTAAAEAPQT